MAQLNAKQSVNQNYGLGGSHSRSSSQPQFFSNNCLPPLSPLPHSESSLASSSSIKDVSMEEVDVSSRGPPPLKKFTELTNQNNELKFCLKAMEQQSQLRDALHEVLTGEVQRLKLAAAELTGNGGSSGSMFQQTMQRPSTSQHQQISVATSKTSTTASATPASA